MVCRREDGDEKSADASPLPLLERNKEVKETKGLKIFTANKLLIRISVLLKAGNNSYKLINGMIRILCILLQHNIVGKTLYNNLIK